MVAIVRSFDKLISMSRRDSVADCPLEAISDSGIGVSGGVGLGVVAEDCWAPAISPLKTQQQVMQKPIRITRCIGAKSEFF